MRSKWFIITIYPLLFLCVTAQDANFGKVVPCYVVEGTVVCPGCNARQGLTCPRVTQGENLCNSSTTTTTTTTTTTVAPTTVAPKVDKSDEGDYSDTPIEVTSSPDTDYETTESEERIIGPRHPTVEKDLAMRIFLYRILRDHDINRKPYFKIPRSLTSEEELEKGTCRWNGDCPCPRICCKNGEGQPMTCKKGIRLPPPWG